MPTRYSQLMPRIYELNTTVMFQQLLLTQADARSWDDNPEDCIRTIYWEDYEILKPHSAAKGFIKLSCEESQNANLSNYFKFLVNLLSTQFNNIRIAEAS